MSRLDFVDTETRIDEIKDELLNPSNTLLKKESIHSLNEEEIDLQMWLEVFAEDQVKFQGCR